MFLLSSCDGDDGPGGPVLVDIMVLVVVQNLV